MATISSRGKKSSDSLGGGLKFEQDNNRIIGRASDGKPNIILSSQPGEQALFEVAQDGYDVTTCTDDQKVMSSGFNMWKIISSGTTGFGVVTRTGTLALDNTTYIGYEHVTMIDLDLPYGVIIPSTSDVLINITESFGTPFQSNGFMFHDGTNIVWRHNFYYLSPLGGALILVQRFRILGGSYTLDPVTRVARGIKWSICNQTQALTGGTGATGPYDPKYYYSDTIGIDKFGNIISPLVSTTEQFRVDEWKTWL